MKRVITYGTFDTLHYGHIRLIQRAKALGDHLTVALSTDEFNQLKGKTSFHSFEERKSFLSSLSQVDQIIEENSWDQKLDDINQNSIDVFVMGSDWIGKFDDLSSVCEVIYLERTDDISSSIIKSVLM